MTHTLELSVLPREVVKKQAPQAFSKTPSPKVSERYTFLSTERIIDDMAKLGWEVCDAKSKRTRIADTAEFGNHIIKFFNPKVFLKDAQGNREAYINILVMNNHNGAGTFRIEAGIFRLVCSNGLVIKDRDMGSYRIRHSGYSFEHLQSVLASFTESLPKVAQRISTYANTIMSKEQQREFASKAIQLRYTNTDRVVSEEEITSILIPRRREDEGDDLWRVLNRVQESILGGGNLVVGSNGKLRRARGIKNIEKDMQINQSIWELSTAFAS